MNNFDKDNYIRLTPDNYKLLIDNARREGAEKAREEMLDVTTKRSIDSAKQYAEKIAKLQDQKKFLLQRIKWLRDSSREKFSWDRDRKPTTEILTQILKDMEE